MDGWLSPRWRAPVRLDLPTGHHLRPIRVEDLAVDHPTVMRCQPRLWARFGPVWGWPPPDMTLEQDRDDLIRHVDEMSRNESFNFAIFDPDERHLLGCVYVDPPESPAHDAEVCWWVVDEEVDGPLDRVLEGAIARWLDDAWPLERPRIVGRDISWADWHAEVEGGDGPWPVTGR
ncbi:MAG: GNAT family N-acetyltransferase [Nitriliruptoraceae bacterium]|nr:GNAT family N-acetyltransferase [Nitriliruptoraceae bacterium]